MLTTHSSIEEIGSTSLQAMLKAEHVEVLVINDERPLNFPLPIARIKPETPNTNTVQKYRALALLEYVNYVTSGAANTAMQKAAARAAKQAQEASCATHSK